jgi:hypothetical protein
LSSSTNFIGGFGTPLSPPEPYVKSFDAISPGSAHTIAFWATAADEHRSVKVNMADGSDGLNVFRINGIRHFERMMLNSGRET